MEREWDAQVPSHGMHLKLKSIITDFKNIQRYQILFKFLHFTILHRFLL